MRDEFKTDPHIHRRRRNLGELPRRKAAIRNHCLECVGWSNKAVRNCTAEKCWLWPWRLGALDKDGVREQRRRVIREKGENDES